MAARRRARKKPVAIEDLGLQPAVCTVLKRHNIDLVSDLVRTSVMELKAMPGIGQKALAQINSQLKRFGLKLLYHTRVQRIQADLGLR